MILFILGLILSIPIAIAANIWTPWVRTYLATRNLSRKQKRIVQVTKELTEAEERGRKSTNSLAAYGITKIIEIVVILSFSILFTVLTVGFLGERTSVPRLASNIAIAPAICAIVMLMFAVIQVSNTRKYFRSVYDFAQYKKRIDRQLKKLGVSAPDLLVATAKREESSNDPG